MFDDMDQLIALRNYNRFMQLFGQPQQITSQDPAQIQNPATQYRPQHNISDMYQQSLMNMPQREQPSRWRRVGAALAGLSGFSPAGMTEGGQPVGLKYNAEVGNNVSDQFLNKKYYQKLGDWNVRNEALGKGALEEEKSNINQRQLVLGEEGRNIERQRAAIAADRAETYQRRVDAQIADLSTKAEILKQKADTYKEVAKGGIIQTDSSGKTYMVYKDGTKKDLEIDKFTPAELEELKQANRLEAIKQQGQNQLQLQGARTSGALATVNARGEQARTTKQTPAPPKPVPGPTQSTATQYDAKGNVVGSIRRESGPKQPEAARVKVKGPNGLVGTVSAEDAKKLPKGWSVVE